MFLKYCEQEKMAFIPWFPLAAGQLSGGESSVRSAAEQWNVTPSQVALAWLLSRSPVILPIPGTSSMEHLEENVAAAGLKIDQNKMQELATAAQGIKASGERRCRDNDGALPLFLVRRSTDIVCLADLRNSVRSSALAEAAKNLFLILSALFPIVDPLGGVRSFWP